MTFYTLDADGPLPVVKITTGQPLLTSLTVFVERFYQTVIMTVNTKIHQLSLILISLQPLLKESLPYFVIGRLNKPNL